MSRFFEYFLFFISLNLNLVSTEITRGRTGKCRPPLPPYWLTIPPSDVSVWPPLLLLHRIDQGITPDGASIGLTDICMELASNGIAIDNRHRNPEISVDLIDSPSVECYCRVDGSVKCTPMNMSPVLQNSIFPLICESQCRCTYGIMCDPEDQDSHPRIFENFRDPAYSPSRSPQKFERFCSFAGCRCDPATGKVVCDDLQALAGFNIRPKDIRPCEESCVCSHDDQPIYIPWLDQVVNFDNSLTLPGQNIHEGYVRELYSLELEEYFRALVEYKSSSENERESPRATRVRAKAMSEIQYLTLSDEFGNLFGDKSIPRGYFGTDYRAIRPDHG